MNPDFSTQTTWDEIGASWPDPMQFRDMDKRKLSGFPYSGGYMRNLITGPEADPGLKRHVFYIGKFPAIRKRLLIEWLNNRTRS